MVLVHRKIKINLFAQNISFVLFHVVKIQNTIGFCHLYNFNLSCLFMNFVADVLQ